MPRIYATEEEWMALVDKLGELRELINQKNQALNGALEMIDSIKYPVVWKYVNDAFMLIEK
jgi:hypothetical protein